MAEKKCPRCHQLRPMLEYGKDAKRKDGIQSWCKVCNRAAARALYHRKSDIYKANARKHRPKLRAELKAIMLDIKSKYGCVLCGEKELCVLEFHHIDHRKDFGGKAVSSQLDSRGSLIREVNKCSVLCANCHKKVHAGKLHVPPDKLCNESINYKKRVFEYGVKYARCTLKESDNGDWVVTFRGPYSITKRILVLKTEMEKATFAADSRKKIVPGGWNGEPDTLFEGWKESTLKNLRRCNAKYYDMAYAIVDDTNMK